MPIKSGERALYFGVTSLRRGRESLLSYVSLYEHEAKSFDWPRQANLCHISPVRPDARHLSQVTLLFKAPRRERFLAYIDLLGSPCSYHRAHRRDPVTAMVAPAVKPPLPYHLLISRRSELRPRSAVTHSYDYRISTSRGIKWVKSASALPSNSIEAYHATLRRRIPGRLPHRGVKGTDGECLAEDGSSTKYTDTQHLHDLPILPSAWHTRGYHRRLRVLRWNL